MYISTETEAIKANAIKVQVTNTQSVSGQQQVFAEPPWKPADPFKNKKNGNNSAGWMRGNSATGPSNITGTDK
jgi:hypothetical protein